MWAVLCAAMHPKQHALYAVIARILHSLAGKKQTPSTSRAHLRPVHRRSHSTAATLPYTQFMSAYSFLQMLGAFHILLYLYFRAMKSHRQNLASGLRGQNNYSSASSL
jgi:hypothetical protein